MNLIPLIDVMLVLMVVFLVTATVLNPTVPLQLPDTQAQVNPPPTQVIQVSITQKGQLYWNDQRLSTAQLQQRLAQAGASSAKPSLQLRADKNSRYDNVAQVLAAASAAGIADIAFVNQ